MPRFAPSRSVCTSVNEVACHGIPSESKILHTGDLLSVDISVFNGRAYGDACRSYVIPGETVTVKQTPDSSSHTTQPFNAHALCAISKECCEAGISVCAPGVPYSAIAAAVTARASKHHCRVVAGIRGHGIGECLHCQPDVIHSVDELTQLGEGISDQVMKPGHVFTVEPCIANSLSSSTESTVDFILPTILSDGWTVVTTDRSLTAQFEHTVLITETKCEILT